MGVDVVGCGANTETVLEGSSSGSEVALCGSFSVPVIFSSPSRKQWYVLKLYSGWIAYSDDRWSLVVSRSDAVLSR